MQREKQESWEQTRWIMYSIHRGVVKKADELKLQEVLKFPWDNEAEETPEIPEVPEGGETPEAETPETPEAT